MFKDLFKDLSMRIFLGHLVAFVAGTLVCAAVNLWLTPDTLWFPWVLMGWGIAVATHALALLLRKTHRRERVFIDPKARSFTVHLFAYVAVVLLLFFVNLVVTPKLWWFYWVALGWGAGIIAHGACAFFRRRPHATSEQTKSAATSKRTKSAATSKPSRRAKRSKPAKPS